MGISVKPSSKDTTGIGPASDRRRATARRSDGSTARREALPSWTPRTQQKTCGGWRCRFDRGRFLFPRGMRCRRPPFDVAGGVACRAGYRVLSRHSLLQESSAGRNLITVFATVNNLWKIFSCVRSPRRARAPSHDAVVHARRRARTRAAAIGRGWMQALARPSGHVAIFSPGRRGAARRTPRTSADRRAAAARRAPTTSAGNPFRVAQAGLRENCAGCCAIRRRRRREKTKPATSPSRVRGKRAGGLRQWSSSSSNSA